MAKFIPIDKMNKLREAARNGDERARKILKAQLSDLDFNADLEEYFKPAPAPMDKPALPGNTKLEQFLADNNVKEGDEEYNDFVEDFYKENPHERKIMEKDQEKSPVQEEENVIDDLIKDEVDAIDSYSRAIVKIMNYEWLDDMQKKRIIARFKEIRGDEEEHYKQLNELKQISTKKIEETEEKVPE